MTFTVPDCNVIYNRIREHITALVSERAAMEEQLPEHEQSADNSQQQNQQTTQNTAMRMPRMSIAVGSSGSDLAMSDMSLAAQVIPEHDEEKGQEEDSE